MGSLLNQFEYDIFISYRHNDNRSGWVTEFVNALQEELASTIKEPLTIYFDKSPHDGLLETHNVDKSLESKLRCLIFIPIISQTYCDTKAFAWQHEFVAFNRTFNSDRAGDSLLWEPGRVGRDIKLSNGNVASRILPIKIHDLDEDDKELLEHELGGVVRAVEFIFKSAGVNRPLRANEDHTQDNLNKTFYRDQVNKVANAIKEIVTALRSRNAPTVRAIGKHQAPVKKTKGVSLRIVVIGVILLLAGIGCILYPMLFSFAKVGVVHDKSIAVLPFVNLSNDKEQEYFSDGLTEEIIDRLTKIPDLRVISRTSVMEYKATNKRIPIIGRELGVAYLLVGSVRKSESNLRITVQLINANNDENIWSETLDRPLSEIFQMQRDIATQLAAYFKITLTESNKGSLNRIPTKFISAYDYYLRALELSSRRMTENNEAIALLKKAVVIDPQFAEAWARISLHYARKGMDFNEGGYWLDSAYNYASKAVSMAPESGIANSYLGFVLFYQDNFPLATTYLKKGYRLGSSISLTVLSSIQRMQGNADSAYYYAGQLIKQDPLSALGSTQMIRVFFGLGAWDSCRYYVKDAKAKMPRQKGDIDAMNFIATKFYIYAGEYDNAIKLIRENSDALDPYLKNNFTNFQIQISALKKDWQTLSHLIAEEDLEWKALMYKNTDNKSEFDKTMAALREVEDESSENMLLLSGNFNNIISNLKALPVEMRYVTYQEWVSNPFASEFVKTTGFRDLFVGYEAWTNDMLGSIEVISASSAQ
jgi:TolB-like protein/Tfp pilus assembly protein PilF